MPCDPKIISRVSLQDENSILPLSLLGPDKGL